jgi:hypothetical protein
MILAAILGVIATSGEHRHGSATLTYLTTSGRIRVLAAKAAFAAIAAACPALAARTTVRDDIT